MRSPLNASLTVFLTFYFQSAAYFWIFPLRIIAQFLMRNFTKLDNWLPILMYYFDWFTVDDIVSTLLHLILICNIFIPLAGENCDVPTVSRIVQDDYPSKGNSSYLFALVILVAIGFFAFFLYHRRKMATLKDVLHGVARYSADPPSDGKIFCKL